MELGGQKKGLSNLGKVSPCPTHPSLGMSEKPRLEALRGERWSRSTQEEAARPLERPAGTPHGEAILELGSLPFSERPQTATGEPRQAGSSSASGRPLVDAALQWLGLLPGGWAGSRENESLPLLDQIPPQDWKLRSVLGN